MSETTEHPDRGNYQVLARRYRSRSFEELVGQEAIMRTLRNAIEHGRTAHAYLFCGTYVDPAAPYAPDPPGGYSARVTRILRRRRR